MATCGLVGKSDLPDEHVVKTNDGIVEARCGRRVIEQWWTEESLVVETPQKPRSTTSDSSTSLSFDFPVPVISPAGLAERKKEDAQVKRTKFDNHETHGADVGKKCIFLLDSKRGEAQSSERTQSQRRH